MLTHIHIRDFAIIEQVELELDRGMTVLTGETGAGKSILVDALALVLGDRADSSAVRHGAAKAEISAAFELAGAEAARSWLEEHDLEADGECRLRRVIAAEGRSRGYINGSPVPMQSLQELGGLLVDIHGQHEHQSLMRRDAQRELLDDYAGHAKPLVALAELHRRWREKFEALERLRTAAEERASRIEFLRFQVEELDALALAPRELEELDEEHGRLANAGRLLEAAQRALAAAYDNDEGSAGSLLGHAVHELAPLAEIDPKLQGALELLNGALIQVEEGASELRGYLDRLELDPQRLEWVENRLGAIHDLARKHRVERAELPALHERLREELEQLENADQRLDELQRERDALADDYRQAAAKLSRSRAKAAKELGSRIGAAMQELGMPGGRFEAALEPIEEGRFTPFGLERVEFRVSANPGQPLKPLVKVASGGELSRISLAIQVITARAAHIATLIFDEVDSGVGGGVAEIVGRQLRALGENRQVLCVTHLPQVAAQGHHHIQVSKSRGKDHTRTGLRHLDGEERIEEIARMLGGVEITSQTRAHAEEMLTGGEGSKAKGQR